MAVETIRVLIVEDNPGDVRLVSEMLRERPNPQFEVRSAGTVGECLNLLSSDRFDVVLLDLNLPDSRGLEGLELVTRREPDIPVIVLTSLDDEETGLLAIHRQASDFLTKGQIDTDLLVRSIRYAIKRRGAEHEIRQLNLNLKRRAEELQTIFDTVPVGIAITEDPEGRHIRGNPANESIFGVPRGGELSFRAPPDRLPPFRVFRGGRELAVEELPMQIAVRGEPVRSQVFEALRADGEARKVVASAEPLFDERGNPRGAVGVFMDITDLSRAEEALRRSEATLHGILDATKESIWLFDPEGAVLMANETGLARFGMSAGEVIGKRFEDILPPPLAASRRERLLETLDSRRPVTFEDGRSGLAFHHTFYPVMDPSGRVTSVTSFSRDITEKKRAEAELKETKAYLEKLVNYANAPIIVWDPDYRITMFNHAFERLTGRQAEEVLGQDLRMLFPESTREGSLAKIARALEGEHWDSVEIPILQRDGGVRLALWNSANIYADDAKTVRATIAQGQDITERKEAEEKLKVSLKEKEVLLKEVHHRVKNNLQIIASMLGMQLELAKTEDVRNPLLESQNRVRTLALIHEKLYGSESLSEISFGEYARELASQIQRVYRPTVENVALELDLEEIPFGVATAIPLGLILNELVSNSYKHAFPQGRQGKILVELRAVGGGRIELAVGDNGIGFREGLDFRRPDSLGLELVGVLTKQLGGDLKLFREGETRFVLTFQEQP